MGRFINVASAMLGASLFVNSVISSSLHNALPQLETNGSLLFSYDMYGRETDKTGATLLGTLKAPTMGKFLTNNVSLSHP